MSTGRNPSWGPRNPRVRHLVQLFTNWITFPATAVPSSDPNTLDDYEEGTANPTPTSGSGSFTSVSASVGYTKIGNRVLIDMVVSITTNGTAAGFVKVALPFTPVVFTALAGAETAVTGAALGAYANTDGFAYIRAYDATYPGADGRDLRVSGSYRV